MFKIWFYSQPFSLLIINLSHKVVHLQLTIDEKINLKTGFILTLLLICERMKRVISRCNQQASEVRSRGSHFCL